MASMDHLDADFLNRSNLERSLEYSKLKMSHQRGPACRGTKESMILMFFRLRKFPCGYSSGQTGSSAHGRLSA